MPELFNSLPAASWWILGFAIQAISLHAVVHVLLQRKEPMAMLAWILGILLIPVAGPLLYYLIGERRVRRRARKIHRRAAPILQALASVAGGTEGAAKAAVVEPHPDLADSLPQLAELSGKLGINAITSNNSVEAFLRAPETYESILRAIDEARHHIHLEYYIFRPDATGRMLLERLAAKARQGVEVRLLLDGIGSWMTRHRFLRPLMEAGGQVATFLPAIPWRRTWHLNCRNHRKLVVVDARVAFTGSQNIGDEYRGLLRPLGPWKDTHLRIEGPAVRQIQEVFIEDWFFAAEENLADEVYLSSQAAAGSSLVQVIPTGPDQAHPILAHVLFAALALARKSIRISTPYFVPGPGLIAALQHAALRGIDVEILIPSRTDSKIVLWAGRSYYPELARAGVRIHEFRHGMLHSKVVSIDDTWTLIGSANMDVRSFLLNFEVTALVFDAQISRQLKADFAADVARSKHIVPGNREPRLLTAILEGAARLLSPLL